LAKLHSDAVDFPKSGRAVCVRPELIADEVPHYMQKAKSKKPIYESNKALGLMYAQMKEVYMSEDDGIIKDVPLAPQLRYGDFEAFRDIAQQDLDAYEFKIKSLMNQFGIGMSLKLSMATSLKCIGVLKRSIIFKIPKRLSHSNFEI